MACTLTRSAGFARAAALALTIAAGLGVALELADRSVFSSTAPHPTVHPMLITVVSILINNARVLAAPFILTVFRFPTARGGRLAGQKPEPARCSESGPAWCRCFPGEDADSFIGTSLPTL